MPSPGPGDSKPTANKPVASNNIVPMSRRATSKARNNIVSTRGGLTEAGMQAAYEKRLQQRKDRNGMAETRNNVVLGPRSSVGNRLAATAKSQIRKASALKKQLSKSFESLTRLMDANSREAAVRDRLLERINTKGPTKKKQKDALYAARALTRLANRAKAKGDGVNADAYSKMAKVAQNLYQNLKKSAPAKNQYNPKNKKRKG